MRTERLSLLFSIEGICRKNFCRQERKSRNMPLAASTLTMEPGKVSYAI